MDGPFAVGVSITCDSGGQMTWFSSSDFLDDMYNAYSSGANVNLGMNALSSMIGESEAMAIRSKSLNYNYLTISDSTSSPAQSRHDRRISAGLSGNRHFCGGKQKEDTK